MVGRSADADVHLTDLWVSRRHCEIGELNGTLTVRDLESRHGTFVNGLKVDQALLMPGDQLTLGISRFQVQYKRGTAKQTAAGEREAVTQE